MAAALLCAAISGSAQTAQTLPSDKYRDYGAGVASCGKWLADRSDWLANRSIQHGVDLSWVLGWLSAAGYYDVRGDLRDTDADAVTAWVDKYCREHPLNEIDEAASSLVVELSKTK